MKLENDHFEQGITQEEKSMLLNDHLQLKLVLNKIN